MARDAKQPTLEDWDWGLDKPEDEVKGWTTREIAEQEGISIVAARALIRRALKEGLWYRVGDRKEATIDGRWVAQKIYAPVKPKAKGGRNAKA